MNEILNHLYQQHRDAERMLAELAEAVRLLRATGSNGSEALSALSGCRAAIQGEVDAHFRQEEQSLFPVLGRQVGTDEGPIAVLMEEHCAFRHLQLEYEAALAALEVGAKGDWAERLERAAAGIVSLLPGHIQKEDEVLFPMAEDLLDAAAWEEVSSLWRQASTHPSP
jgi:regulator of cell morphogenesis and NO signaling